MPNPFLPQKLNVINWTINAEKLKIIVFENENILGVYLCKNFCNNIFIIYYKLYKITYYTQALSSSMK